MQAIMAGMEATWWLNDKLYEWLGEKNAADTLTLSAPGNITSEMGLALLDVADVIRPLPEVLAFLQDTGQLADDTFLDELPKRTGGPDARAAIEAYLDRYGMRCVGEIDITRPRWRERPTTLVPVILDNVRNFEPGAAARRFEEGLEKARQKEADVLSRLRALPADAHSVGDGDAKADETRRMIERVRTFIGYREYPKYGIIRRYFIYKRALLEEAGRLVRAGVLDDTEDIYYLTFEELHDVARTNRADHAAHPAAQGRLPYIPVAHPAARAHLGRRGRPRNVSARGRAGRRADRSAGVRGDGGRAGARHPRHGGGRSRGG